MGLPWRIDPTTHRTMSERSYHEATSHSLEWEIAQWVHHEGSIRRPIAPWTNTLSTELHLAPVRRWHCGIYGPTCSLVLSNPTVELRGRAFIHGVMGRWIDPSWGGPIELFLIPASGALAGTRNSSMGLPWRIDPTTHHTMSERSYHEATSHSLEREIAQWVYHEGSIRRPIAPWANDLTTKLHLTPWNEK